MEIDIKKSRPCVVEAKKWEAPEDKTVEGEQSRVEMGEEKQVLSTKRSLLGKDTEGSLIGVRAWRVCPSAVWAHAQA